MKIKAIIRIVCNELSIDPPEVSLDTSVFDSETQMAAYDPKGNVVHLRTDEATPETVFAVCHELRHEWQKKYQLSLLLGHKNRMELSVEEYNRQPAEIDANAYAALFCEEIMGMRPTFAEMPDDVRECIEKRMGAIEY